jgi:hypothetical protein
MKSNIKLREYGVTYFFEYNQNNSGGSFDADDKVTHRLYIEAEDSNKADRIAQGLGVYFNGCENGMDCECCGDRWYSGRQLEAPYINGLFTKDEAIEIEKKFGGKSKMATKWKPHRDRTHEVEHGTIENYVQYMVDQYGYDFEKFPDSRIYYLNGEVKEFFSERHKMRRQ